MYRILASSVDDNNVTIRAACVETLIEAKAFAMAILTDKLSLPVTRLHKIENGFYGAYFGGVLVGFCEIESLRTDQLIPDQGADQDKDQAADQVRDLAADQEGKGRKNERGKNC